MRPMPRWTLALSYGLVCHGAFTLGVAAMITAMFFGMSRSLGTVPAPWNWAANALLMVQFLVVHSFLLTKRGRVLLTRLAPGATGRTLSSTTYAAIASVQISVLFALWSPTGTVWWQAHGTALVIMSALYAAAWLLLLKAMADAGLGLQTGSLGWTALFRNRNPTYPKMPSTGLFRLTRQPIYVGFSLIVWTVPTWTPDQLMLAVVLTAYCRFAPRFKEERYRRMYGSAFDSYACRVPYWLPWPRKSL
jgi:methanethiol S-methyltransferase